MLKSNPLEFAPQILHRFEQVTTGHKKVHAVRCRYSTIVDPEFAFSHLRQCAFDPSDGVENVLSFAALRLWFRHVQNAIGVAASFQ